MALDLRLHHLIAYWLLLNALAIPALVRALPGCRPPRWLIAGFCAGGAFLLTPQVYYHYLVPVVPFASLLAAPLLLRLTRSVRLALVPAALALTAASALAVSYGDTNWRLAVTASHFSEIHPVVAYLERSTTPDTYVLGDRFEYAYLAGRRSSADYYWNLHTLVRASDLEHRLRGVSVVVATGGWGMYPDGFIEYLTDHPYPQRSLGPANLWLLAATGPTAPRPDGV